ncbi:uncharacterized protein LOC119185255 isoform X4 [Rhipicephalus microplus]|uniref:uncharacterized protein LOC119185255 isoform X4 n=1 Tax=Rhipicephalus microplus TaxID=6941 RepID=UPI003F6D59F4
MSSILRHFRVPLPQRPHVPMSCKEDGLNINLPQPLQLLRRTSSKEVFSVSEKQWKQFPILIALLRLVHSFHGAPKNLRASEMA